LGDGSGGSGRASAVLDEALEAGGFLPRVSTRRLADATVARRGDLEEAVHGWSVATTGEAPSMTVIANDPASREEAQGFPTWTVVTAPSALEKALTNHLKQTDGGFWDMSVEPFTLDAHAVSRWRDHGARVRARPDASEPEALAPGRRTDQALAGGEWLAFPARGGGFGVALFLPRPPSHLRTFSDGLVFVFERVWSRWPTLSEARELTTDDVVALAQTSMICVRDGRWRVLERDGPFNTEYWPLPMWWTPVPPVTRASTSAPPTEC
jgi:hypothetical protein